MLNSQAGFLVDFLGLRTGAVKTSFTFTSLPGHQVYHFENATSLTEQLTQLTDGHFCRGS
jgi:hypothetical protein